MLSFLFSCWLRWCESRNEVRKWSVNEVLTNGLECSVKPVSCPASTNELFIDSDCDNFCEIHFDLETFSLVIHVALQLLSASWRVCSIFSLTNSSQKIPHWVLKLVHMCLHLSIFVSLKPRKHFSVTENAKECFVAFKGNLPLLESEKLVGGFLLFFYGGSLVFFWIQGRIGIHGVEKSLLARKQVSWTWRQSLVMKQSGYCVVMPTQKRGCWVPTPTHLLRPVSVETDTANVMVVGDIVLSLKVFWM